MPIQLFVGLANPGKEYASTRHNAGAWWVQALCADQNITLQTQSKLQAAIGQGQIGNFKFKCAIPTTYMNHSGQAVAKIAQYFAIPVEDIVIVHDELDFEPGIIRAKIAGGHGGHNGLRDVIPQLGSEKFYRLRIGIGHPGHKDQVSDYVLGTPSKQDKELITTAIADSIRLFPDMVAGNWAEVMSQLH